MILITGASGNVGKTVLQEVAKSGAQHRAMYRSAAEAAKASAGTETVVADFAKPETLGAALKNVDSVYLVCSPIPELVQLASQSRREVEGHAAVVDHSSSEFFSSECGGVFCANDSNARRVL